MGPFFSRAAERELERLQEALERAAAEGDDAEVVAIQQEIRDVEREAAEQERWEDEGRDRGWF